MFFLAFTRWKRVSRIFFFSLKGVIKGVKAGVERAPVHQVLWHTQSGISVLVEQNMQVFQFLSVGRRQGFTLLSVNLLLVVVSELLLCVFSF